MWLIIGLGNRGSEYDGTRHNVGFEIVDMLSQHHDITLKAGKGEYYIGVGRIGAEKVSLAKPITYMNNSGEAIIDILERYRVSLDRLLIVCDDFQLPLGTLRLRPKGSDGGHNGLYSIIYHLQTDTFARLRCGIASSSLPNKKNLMARFVLEPFSKDERAAVNSMVIRAREACEFLVIHGLENAMNTINTRQKI